MAYAAGTGIRRGSLFEIKPSAAEIASTTHRRAHPDNAGTLAITVDVTVVTGTLPTLNVIVEGSVDGTTWFKLGAIGSDGYSVGSVSSTPADITAAVTVTGVFPLAEHVRTRSVVTGTLPSFTYSVQAVVS